MLSGFYLNELIIHLTTRHDPQPQLFERLRPKRCAGSRRDAAPEPALRVFEKRLLESIGYGLEFVVDAAGYYQFRPTQGLRRGSRRRARRLFRPLPAGAADGNA